MAYAFTLWKCSGCKHVNEGWNIVRCDKCGASKDTGESLLRYHGDWRCIMCNVNNFARRKASKNSKPTPQSSSTWYKTLDDCTKFKEAGTVIYPDSPEPADAVSDGIHVDIVKGSLVAGYIELGENTAIHTQEDEQKMTKSGGRKRNYSSTNSQYCGSCRI